MSVVGGSTPLVSVLIPTYNGARFIAAALESVLAQTYPRLEIVVGDDASTDATPDIAERVAGGDPRVTVVRRETNAGAFDNPRLLLEDARGELVKWVLQDDLLAPQAIERLAAPMIADESVVLATSKRGLIDDQGHRLPDQPHTLALAEGAGTVPGRELGDHALERLQNCIGEMTTVLFRNGLVDTSQLWSLQGRVLRGNGDFALWLKLLAQGQAFYTAEELSFFRVHGGQRTGNRSVIVGATSDWPFLIDGARALGFLSDPRTERQALAVATHSVAATLKNLVHDEESAQLIETAYLTLGRLVELQRGADPSQGRIDERLHGAAFLEGLRQPLGTAPVTA